MKRPLTGLSFVTLAFLVIQLGSGQNKALAQEAADMPKTVVLHLKHADATDVEKIIKDVYKDHEKEGKVKVAADVRKNSLLITASDKLAKEIEELLKALDAASADAATKPKVVVVPLIETISLPQEAVGVPKTVVFPLKYAEAESVEKTIKALYSDVDQAGKAKIVAEVRTNSLVVSAPDDIVKQIEELLKILDAAPQTPAKPPAEKELAEIKVFALANADAQETVRVVSDLVGKSVQITADPRTNSLIVTGQKKDVEVVQAILLRLDESQNQRSNILQVYSVKHAPVEKTLQTLSQLGVGANIAMDADQHRLLVLGDEEAHKLIGEMIRSIDVAEAGAKLQPMQLRIVWLVDEKLAGKDARDPAKNLEKVLKVLEEKLGVTNLKMAAQMLVTIDPAREGVFTANGTPQLQEGFNIELSAEGHIVSQTGPNPTIELSIKAIKPAAVTDRAGFRVQASNQTLTSLNTQVVAPAGHSIVVGMTPIQSADSVFVLQVLSNEDPPAAVK